MEVLKIGIYEKMIIFEIKIDIIKRLLTELNTIIYSPETSQLKKKKKKELWAWQQPHKALETSVAS